MAFLNETGLARLLNGLKTVFARVNHGNHVPTTETADNAKFLRCDNSWQLVTPANIGAYTDDEVDTLLAGKSNTGHTHDDRYYTESEIDTQVSGLSARIDALDPDKGVGIFKDVSITITTSNWTADQVNHVWTYTYQNPLITQRCGVEAFYDQSFRTAIAGDIYTQKNTGSVVFTTNKAPTGTLTCTLRVLDSVQGVVPVDHGGTGAETAAGARTALGINAANVPMSGSDNTSVSAAIDKLSESVTYVVVGNQSVESATIPVGSYVRLVNSTIAGRSDGIYTVKTSIPVAPTVLDNTYFNENSPIHGGVANALSSKLTWKQLDSKTNKGSCSLSSLPSDYRELLIVVKASVYVWTFIEPKEAINESGWSYFSQGYTHTNGSSAANLLFAIHMGNKTTTVESCSINNGEQTAVTTTIYYR